MLNANVFMQLAITTTHMYLPHTDIFENDKITAKLWLNIPHNLLLEGFSGDESVHVDNLLLSNAVGAVHGLKVLHWVPVVLHEDYGIRTGQIQTKATGLQNKNIFLLLK